MAGMAEGLAVDFKNRVAQADLAAVGMAFEAVKVVGLAVELERVLLDGLVAAVAGPVAVCVIKRLAVSSTFAVLER